MSALVDPWRDPLMLRAFAEVALVGVAGGVLGCWLLPYRLAYGAEALSHALLPGLVVAALLGLPLLLGAAGGIAVAAGGIALAARAPGLGRDTATAVAVTTLLGLGALLALSAEAPPRLEALLFGDVLGVTDGELALGAALVAALLAGLAAVHWRLLAVGFDRGATRRLGLSPAGADLALLGALALALLVAVQGLGNLLAVALLVGPAATARLLARRMAPTMALAAAVGVGCGVAGLCASYHLDTAAGASVAAATVAVYGAVAAATTLGRHGRAGTVGLG